MIMYPINLEIYGGNKKWEESTGLLISSIYIEYI